MESTNVFDSRIKKLRIELPQYRFSHSSSGESSYFVGRSEIQKKLRKLIEATTDKAGVYLVTGNRGVGKTRLVNQIINQTSLQPNSNFFQNLRYFFSLLVSVTVIQFCLHFLQNIVHSQNIEPSNSYLVISAFFLVVFFIFFIILYVYNGHRHIFPKPHIAVNFWAAIIEFCFFINKNNPYRRRLYLLKILLVVCSTQFVSNLFLAIFFRRQEIDLLREYIFLAGAFFIYLICAIINMYRQFCKGEKWRKYNYELKKIKLRRERFFFKVQCFFSPFKNYIKSHKRLYLRINFGHKLKNEKDILRLIARTLSTEYHKYYLSFGRLPFWRVTAVLLSLVFAYVICEKTPLRNMIDIIESDLIFFGLSFILMHLIFALLFRCRWVTRFFVTHQIIMQQLKRLNIDITHSTENENAISIQNKEIGTGIGTKTKKSRNVADAREIEKELQDIFDNMQRIPTIMSRPDIVIVFDELDKVELDETHQEKEIQKTKASLFSINITRERQTEILSILSNMKYFLSTANAKFIFIAGREMYDIYLADVSDRNNYIGSIFNAVLYVPSFLTDRPDGSHANMTSLTEEFVCRRLIPHDYYPMAYKGKPHQPYNLKMYRYYLKEKIYEGQNETQEIQKTIAILQQFIIYLAHVSKGAPKKIMQLFETFIESEADDVRISEIEREKVLLVQRYSSPGFFLVFDYYKQYMLGIIAYMITPIFNRLSESNIEEHSDKLLVSSLRLIDFIFKFHKHSFSWKHLDISPEMLEANHPPELKSVVSDLLNFLTRIHINKSTFSLYDYKFDSFIANEIFVMTKTDEVFSALYSFSLDETLPLKKHYQDLLEKTQKEYHDKKNSHEFIHAISSLQVVLGDLHFFDDELQEAGVYYRNIVQNIRHMEQKTIGRDEEHNTMPLEQFYMYVRNMLKLGMIYEKRKHYDFAYLTYGELCKWIMRECCHTSTASKKKLPDDYDFFFKKMTYEGLKLFYLPFLAKLQILEKSHVGGIRRNHLKQLNNEFKILTSNITHEETSFLKADFFSRLADIIYYKNSDIEEKRNKKNVDKENCSCTACYYYRLALSTLLNSGGKENIKGLLLTSVMQIGENYNMKFCTVLARILSDWGNVFFSCDKKDGASCFMLNEKNCSINNIEHIFSYLKSESAPKNREPFLRELRNSKNKFSKIEISFTMYAISLHAYRKASLYKRSAYQVYKMLRLFKYYEIYKHKWALDFIKNLSQMTIQFLFHSAEYLNIFELNKRKSDFSKYGINDEIPLQFLLLDSEITKILVLVKDLELRAEKTTGKLAEKLKEYYKLPIASPNGIIYSVVARIYQLRLKSIINYEAYKMFIKYPIENENGNKNLNNELFSIGNLKEKNIQSEIIFILYSNYSTSKMKEIFGDFFKEDMNDEKETQIKTEILGNLIVETIFCLKEIIRLSNTIGETYLFSHSFMGSMHNKLSYWIRRFETCRKEKNIDEMTIKVFRNNFDEMWYEQLSGHYENQQALLHYYKSLETHKEGRAYHNMIDNMCYIKDDYNDRIDHFHIAEERHDIINNKIHDSIYKKNKDNNKGIKERYGDSKLYALENYYK